MSFNNLPSSDRVVLIKVFEDSEGQRLDNFLTKICKGVPKSHLYKIIRSGQVRVNKKKASAETRLKEGDELRIPPLKTKSTQANLSKSMSNSSFRVHTNFKVFDILYEDEGFLAISKPSGLAVHGGSGQSFGVIEQLRQTRADCKSLELVHRIDRSTSGLLLIAKKRSYLRALQEQLRQRLWKKHYEALVLGHWPESLVSISLPLKKLQVSAAEKKVIVSPEGDEAKTLVRVKERFSNALGEFTLLELKILTGRMHQIRVHTSSQGFPIAGDDRYGHFVTNKILSQHGLRRMFLHAKHVSFEHPVTKELVSIQAPLSDELDAFLKLLRHG